MEQRWEKGMSKKRRTGGEEEMRTGRQEVRMKGVGGE